MILFHPGVVAGFFSKNDALQNGGARIIRRRRQPTRAKRPETVMVTPEVAPASKGWKRYLPPFLLFLVFYSVVTAFTYRDYPLTWDEPLVLHYGRCYYDYYFKGHHDNECVSEPDYSTHSDLYSMLQVLATGDREVPWETYHLFNMLFALLLYWAAYRLLRAQTGHATWALAGPILLYLSPLLTGHIPVNTKDVSFAVLYFVSLVAVYFTADRPPLSVGRLLVLGGLFGLTLSLRLVGATLFPILFLFDVWRRAVRKEGGWTRWILRETGALLLILAATQAVLVLVWPYLAADYGGRILEVFRSTAHFQWMSGTIYLGRLQSSQDLPWHYVPVWMAVTTPLFILGFFIAGLWKGFRRPGDAWWALAVSCLSVNAAVWFVVRPEIYNGIRHYLFLYPVMTALAAQAFVGYARSFLRPGPKSWAAWGVVLATVLNVALVVTAMIRLHPYQYAYFNELVGGIRGGSQWFEADYWAMSTRDGLLWVREDMKTRAHPPKVGVIVTGQIAQFAAYASPEMEYRNIPLSPEGDWDYAVINLTKLKFWWNEDMRKYIVHTVEKDGAPLSYVFYKERGKPLTP